MKRRPGRLWLFFYGRQRRGMPWLLIAVVVGVVVLAITFAVPGGPEMWRTVAPILIGALLVGGIVAAIAAMARPRRR